MAAAWRYLLASSRRPRGILEGLGGVSELPSRFVLGLGHDIAFVLGCQTDFEQYKRLPLIVFEGELGRPYMMLCMSV